MTHLAMTWLQGMVVGASAMVALMAPAVSGMLYHRRKRDAAAGIGGRP
jgi:hypothetical protein